MYKPLLSDAFGDDGGGATMSDDDIRKACEAQVNCKKKKNGKPKFPLICKSKINKCIKNYDPPVTTSDSDSSGSGSGTRKGATTTTDADTEATDTKATKVTTVVANPPSTIIARKGADSINGVPVPHVAPKNIGDIPPNPALAPKEGKVGEKAPANKMLTYALIGGAVLLVVGGAVFFLTGSSSSGQ